MVLNPATPPSRPTVLVVDDSRAALDGLCNLLKADCNALFGLNGLEALALATSESPDLIVLDVAMPGMDGYEVLRRLKEEPATRDIPVIFLTTPGPSVSEARALELGAIDFITKPYDPTILKARMHNQLAYKRSLDQAMALSLHDALTGIPNRRRFDEHLDQEWARGFRTKKPISMILMDIDHFKRFNDALGHPAGDSCLQRVADVLSASLQRSLDFVARYGGEEFACILTETDAMGALEVAQRIATNVAAARVPHPDSPVSAQVTLSIGVATVVPDVDMQPLELTQEADRRLYAAKALGRNRIQAESVPEAPVAPEPPGILLVEDDERQRDFLVERLSVFGLQVHWAPNVAEAMTALLRRPPALVLSAGTMPSSDGYSLCQWIRDDPFLRGIPFAILASPWDGPKELSFQSGADDRILKNEDEVVFRARVRLLLELGSSPGTNLIASSGASFLLLSPPGALRSVMLTQLSLEGIRTTFASNLEEALQALRSEAPDALILDLSLLDGAPAEALDQIRAFPECAELPILVLADKDQSLLVDALEAWIQDRLETPLDPEECRHRARLLARCAHARRRLSEASTRTHVTGSTNFHRLKQGTT
jgi:diguanylate cyclase (GGDEF)-like protein